MTVVWRVGRLLSLAAVLWFLCRVCVPAGDEWDVTAPSGKKVRIIVPEGAVAGTRRQPLVGWGQTRNAVSFCCCCFRMFACTTCLFVLTLSGALRLFARSRMV